jgi:hypothetical protein
MTKVPPTRSMRRLQLSASRADLEQSQRHQHSRSFGRTGRRKVSRTADHLGPDGHLGELGPTE